MIIFHGSAEEYQRCTSDIFGFELRSRNHLGSSTVCRAEKFSAKVAPEHSVSQAANTCSLLALRPEEGS